LIALPLFLGSEAVPFKSVLMGQNKKPLPHKQNQNKESYAKLKGLWDNTIDPNIHKMTKPTGPMLMVGDMVQIKDELNDSTISYKILTLISMLSL